MNLIAFRDSARRVDRVRADRLAKESHIRAKDAEERELRAKLIGASATTTPEAAERHSDRTAGLAAESDAIASYLIKIDQILAEH